MSSPYDHDPEEIALFCERAEDVTALLESVVSDRSWLTHLDPELRQRLLVASGRISKPDRSERRKLARANRRGNKSKRRDEDLALLNRTGIRRLRENPIFQTPKRKLKENVEEAPQPTIGELSEKRACYVCLKKYTSVHFFYDHMCVECGDFNFAKRTQTADLNGRVALVTGARLKIGYQAAILLLRSGCHVIVTTRFPKDAAQRYSIEEDFDDWGHRLEIHGIDLRHTPSIEALCETLRATHDRLDFIINNACQTVRRPPGFYDHLMASELSDIKTLSPHAQKLLATSDTNGLIAAQLGKALPAATLSQIPLIPSDAEGGEALFPTGSLDADLQQVDLRKVNSWRLMMAEVPTVELLEVHLVNAVAPFVLNARLKPLMMRVPTRDKHIVNVSAMEGQFYRTFKSPRHPHTNMAKASLNMMTRTASLDYIEDGIHMNSVDTGWVTDEDPIALAERKRELHHFHPPLDIVDGAARIVDPIFEGIRTGVHVWGQFLKDYRETDW